MIIVTVGTEKFPFDRLMNWLDSLIQQGFLQPEQEEVIVQYGSCTLQPKGVNNYSLLPRQRFSDLLKKARLVIAHCGEGTIDQLAAGTTPFILVPRTHDHEEHVDNHQVELANQLTKMGAPIARTPGDLVRFLAAPKRVKLATPKTYYHRACSMLSNQLAPETSTTAQPAFS